MTRPGWRSAFQWQVFLLHRPEQALGRRVPGALLPFRGPAPAFGGREVLGEEAVPLRQLFHGHAHTLRRANLGRMGRVSYYSYLL